MDSGRRPKRVAHLIQQALSRIILQEFQDGPGLITVTRVEMSVDLQTAHVYLSLFGAADEPALWERLEKSRGRLRKCLASEVKLRYNPTLVLHRDPASEFGSRMDQLIERFKDDKS